MPKTKSDQSRQTVSEVQPDSNQMEGVTQVDTQVSELQQQVQSLETSWKRALADYQNLLRRIESEKKEFIRVSTANLMARLIPSLDIIDMAATHTKDLGVEMAAKQFRNALVEEGLQEIIPVIGTEFDHNLHECSETVSTSNSSEDNHISEIVLKGYKLADYVLRPAKVKVFKLALDN